MFRHPRDPRKGGHGARRFLDPRRAAVRGRPYGLYATVLALVPAFASGAESQLAGSCPLHLFVLERSKNANVVVYDARRTPTGDLADPDPVVAYWLLNGKEGAREELNPLERQHAYGFDVTPAETPGTYRMVFRAERRRRLAVLMLNGCPVATTSIGGQDGVLRRLFVQAKEGALPKVDYVEFFGEDLVSGKPLYDKFVPEK